LIGTVPHTSIYQESSVISADKAPIKWISPGRRHECGARQESIHMENHIFLLAPVSGNVSGIRPHAYSN